MNKNNAEKKSALHWNWNWNWKENEQRERKKKRRTFTFIHSYSGTHSQKNSHMKQKIRLYKHTLTHTQYAVLTLHTYVSERIESFSFDMKMVQQFPSLVDGILNTNIFRSEMLFMRKCIRFSNQVRQERQPDTLELNSS